MSDIDDAFDLAHMIGECLKVFKGDRTYKEDEVSFRYDAIRGILLMAHNDVLGMAKQWQQEDKHESTNQ